MRLTQQQKRAIKQISLETFGPDIKLYLFGSRMDDSRLGGDIDLYVVGFDVPLPQQVAAKLRFLTKVKLAIGEQRIDVVYAPGRGQPCLPIHHQAEQTGILL